MGIVRLEEHGARTVIGRRLDGTTERATSGGAKGVLRRLTLRRADGRVYLDRWGAQIIGDRLGIYLHKMSAPDPGIDLHDHPWTFITIPLWGGYTEERALCREAPGMAKIADRFPDTCTRGVVEHRRWLRPRMMRLDECHRITALDRPTVWTLVLRGPRRRKWGFYGPWGYLPEPEYDATIRAGRRDLWSDQAAAYRPWSEHPEQPTSGRKAER